MNWIIEFFSYLHALYSARLRLVGQFGPGLHPFRTLIFSEGSGSAGSDFSICDEPGLDIIFPRGVHEPKLSENAGLGPNF